MFEFVKDFVEELYNKTIQDPVFAKENFYTAYGAVLSNASNPSVTAEEKIIVTRWWNEHMESKFSNLIER